MGKVTSLREAFQQGYVRGVYKVMGAVNTAFRRGWQPAEIEDMLRRMNTQQETEAEANVFEAFNEGSHES